MGLSICTFPDGPAGCGACSAHAVSNNAKLYEHLDKGRSLVGHGLDLVKCGRRVKYDKVMSCNPGCFVYCIVIGFALC